MGDGGGVLWRGSEERAKGGEESLSGAFVVPVHALGVGGGLCSGRSTAVLRWRPRGRFWARRGAGHGREGSSARQQVGKEEQRDAWAPARSKGVAGKALHVAGVGALHGGGEKQSRGLGEGEKDPNTIPKTPGTPL